MTDPRSRGPLSPADRKLWERVVGDVRPLKERPPADPSPAPDSEKTPAKAPPRITKAPAPRRPALPPPKPPPELRPGSTAGVDKRTANRFRRGQMAIDGRLDLHGYTQEPAYAALRGFITGAAGAGRRCLLVVTGKGYRAEDGVGVLRAAVPRWLNQPPLRDLVLAIAPAQPRDGGDGAFYVLLRRRREGDRDERVP